jgi:uncharacterized Zn-finger protein
MSEPEANQSTDSKNAEKSNVIEVSGHSAACDGGGGALGHPKVYLEMGGEPKVDCPYCGRTFVRKPS